MYDFFSFFFQFEDAAKEVADEITNPRPEGEEEVQDIQVMLNSTANPCNIRTLKVSIHFTIRIMFYLKVQDIQVMLNSTANPCINVISRLLISSGIH